MKPPQGYIPESIQAQAAAWLAERDGGFDAEASAAFARWRDADPRHAEALRRLDRTWTALARLRSYRPFAALHPDPDLLRPRVPAKRRLPVPRWALALAAAVSLTLVSAVWLGDHPLAQRLLPRDHVHVTQAGGYQRLVLPDGSMIELNERTEVHVRYDSAERRIRLVRGEAHFNVAKDSARPFRVETGRLSVRAVGTAFNVRLDEGSTQVLVTEGTVQFEPESPTVRGAAQLEPSPARLDAGWRATVPLDPSRTWVAERLNAADIRDALSWQDSRLVFVETPLAEVVRRFNLRNHVQLSLADPELASLPIGGSFRAENVEAFVRLLTSGGEIAVERPEPDRIVLRRVR